MSDISLESVTSGYNLSRFNVNFELLEDNINDEILHLVGGNNVMQQDIDLNSSDLLNCGNVDVTNLSIGGVDVTATELATTTLPDQTGNSGKFLTTNGTSASWDEVRETVDTVFDLISLSLPSGTLIFTRGYTSVGDGGGGKYLIRTSGEFGGTPDEIGDHTIANSNVAELQTDFYIFVEQYGTVHDGTTDDASKIQAALDKGESVQRPVMLGPYRYGNSGLNLAEGAKLLGMGMADNSGIGTWLIPTGANWNITIDGEWVGFDSRRSIDIDGVNMECFSSALGGINADFWTRGVLRNCFIRGNTGVGVNLINSYNLQFQNVIIDGPTTGFVHDIKTSPNDVFSGQSYFMGCDFWNCTIGFDYKASDNVMAEVGFYNCHFKTNATGFKQSGANTKAPAFYSCHFEESSVNDVFVASGVLLAPHIRDCFLNNTNAVSKIDCDGEGLIVDGCELVSGNGMTLRSDSARITNNRLRNLTTGISVAASASNTLIGPQRYSSVTTNISDSSSTTYYENEEILTTEDLDLAVTSDSYHFQANREYSIVAAELLCQENTNAGGSPSTVDVGVDGDTTKYLTRNGPTQSKGARVNASLTSGTIEVGDIVRVGVTADGSTGVVRARLRLVPYEV